MKHACEGAHGRYKRGGDRTRVRGMVFSLHTIAVIPDHKAHSEKAPRYSMGLKKNTEVLSHVEGAASVLFDIVVSGSYRVRRGAGLAPWSPF